MRDDLPLLLPLGAVTGMGSLLFRHPHANLQEAQALQVLVMVLVEILDDVRGSRAVVHTELARAMSLLGYTLQASGAATASQEPWADVEEHRDDTSFMGTHGLRFCEDEPPGAPLQSRRTLPLSLWWGRGRERREAEHGFLPQRCFPLSYSRACTAVVAPVRTFWLSIERRSPALWRDNVSIDR
jgi:hypothetical protein